MLGGLAWHIKTVQVPAHHQLDHLVVVDIVAIESSGILSISQNHDPICEFLNLAQAVRYIDDAHSLCAKILHNAEELLGLGEREAGSGLIHDEKAGIQRNSPCDLHHLLMRGGQVTNQGPRRKPQIQASQNGDRVPVDLFAIDESKRSSCGFTPEKNVAGNVERIDDFQFLVNDADAVTSRIPR